MRQPRMKRDRNGELLVERFTPIRRAEHWLAIVTFVGLCVTGFPQKLEGQGSAWLIGVLGGLENTRFLHRAFGVVFCLHAFTHIASAAIGMATRRLRPALLPVSQDLRDAWMNLGYFLGFKPRPPKLPQFDYRQKFEYMGLILGGMVMVFSGLALMYPVQTAALLPAQIIPAAYEAHSNEAMLALIVLVVWHMYGSIFSPEVYPLDKSVFTGYITAKELEEHHTLEFERLFPDGVPAGPEAPPPVKTPEAPLTQPIAGGTR